MRYLLLASLALALLVGVGFGTALAQDDDEGGDTPAAGKGPSVEDAIKAAGGSAEKALYKEEEKHRIRVAKLERIREVMKEKGNTEAVTQIEKALKKENARYNKRREAISAKDDGARENYDKTMQRLAAKENKARAAKKAQAAKKAKGGGGDGDDDEGTPSKGKGAAKGKAPAKGGDDDDE